MKICRGASAVPVLAALAFVALLAPPVAGQPTRAGQSAPTSSTVAQSSSTTVPGGGSTTFTQPQQSITSSPFGTSAPVTTTAPGVSQSTLLAPGSGGEVGAPGRGAVLVLVRRLTWRQAATAVRGRSETIAAGLVSTLPGDASLAARVLSLAAGRQVDASALAGGADAAAIERMRAANPDAHFGGLPQVRVVAAAGLEAAALIGLGPAGGPPPAAPLEVTGPPPPGPGELLVVAVPDAAGLRRVLEQVQPASSPSSSVGGTPGAPGVPQAPGVGGAPGAPAVPGVGGAPDPPPPPSRFVIVGLEAPKGRAHTAPFVALGGAPGLVTSDSTRRRGLVALQDVRPTLAGSAAGTDGSTIRALAVVDPLGSVNRLDRRVVSLVAARAWAIPLAVGVGTVAVAVSLLALLLRRGSGGRGREVLRRLARALLLLTLALPSGYLVASEAAPPSWLGWLLLGLGSGVVLALAAWLVGSFWRRPRPRSRATPKPAKATSPSAVPAAAPVPGPEDAAGSPATAGPGAAGGATSPVGSGAAGGSGDAGGTSPVAEDAPASAAKGDAAATAAKEAPVVAPVGAETEAPVAEPAAKKTPDAEPDSKDRASSGAPASTAAGAGSWAPPALLGALLTTLIVVDLLLGGLALSRPLLGNSAFDGERFYGLGNGYFAHALAGLFLVIAFRQPSALTAAALLAGLSLVDGLPILGADVGGALTAMLTAAAAWLLLRRRRWSTVRVLLVVAGALVLAVAIAFGVSFATGQLTHGGRIARELLGSDPSAALRAVQHQLSGNFGLLAENFWAWWGPLLVLFTAVASRWPPRLLASVPAQVRRAVGVGAIGSLLLIVLNDTGVTAAAGSGLALLVTLAWCALERPPAPPAAAEPEPAGEPALEAATPVEVKPTETSVPAKPTDTDELWKPPRAPTPAKPTAAPSPAGPAADRRDRAPDWGDLPTPPIPASRRRDPRTPPASGRVDPATQPKPPKPAPDRAGPDRSSTAPDGDAMASQDPNTRHNGGKDHSAHRDGTGR
jgi:hypothetical protein